MGDGYTKENKLSKSAQPFINKAAVFEAAMTLPKFERRFIICRLKLHLELFDIKNWVDSFVKVGQIDAGGSRPCSHNIICIMMYEMKCVEELQPNGIRKILDRFRKANKNFICIFFSNCVKKKLRNLCSGIVCKPI